jgi:hypothetical protein
VCGAGSGWAVGRWLQWHAVEAKASELPCNDVEVSENWLCLIATDPTWVPDEVAEACGKVVLRRQASDACEVSTETFGEITFVDCGGNLQGIYCPLCGAAVSIPWWQEAMDAAFKSHFANLHVTTACCGGSTTLNDLRFDWAMGFARWQLVAFSPGRNELDDVEAAELGEASGTRCARFGGTSERYSMSGSEW